MNSFHHSSVKITKKKQNNSHFPLKESEFVLTGETSSFSSGNCQTSNLRILTQKLSLRKQSTFSSTTSGFHEDRISAEIPHWWCLSLLNSRQYLVVPQAKIFSTNQKHYPDLGSDTLSAQNFFTHSSYVILQGNQQRHEQNVGFLLKLKRKNIPTNNVPLWQ